MKLVHCFLGADLRAGHTGLAEIAKSQSVDLSTLESGTAAVFVNRKRDRIKALSYNGVLSYVICPNGIDLHTLDILPQAFRPSGQMDYKSALRIALRKRFSDRRATKPGTLEVL